MYYSSIGPSYASTWVAKARDVIGAWEAGTHQFRLGASTSHYPPGGLSATIIRYSCQRFFGTAEEAKWKYVLPVTIEGVIVLALSKSYISALPEIEQNKMADGLRNILETQQKTWVNEEEGVFEYPYQTTVVTIRRK